MLFFSVLFPYVLARIIIVEKGNNTPCSPGDGLEPVMATSFNKHHLVSLMKKCNITSAGVCGYDGSVGNLVIRDNGNIAPYEKATNPTAHIFAEIDLPFVRPSPVCPPVCPPIYPPVCPPVCPPEPIYPPICPPVCPPVCPPICPPIIPRPAPVCPPACVPQDPLFPGEQIIPPMCTPMQPILPPFCPIYPKPACINPCIPNNCTPSVFGPLCPYEKNPYIKDGAVQYEKIVKSIVYNTDTGESGGEEITGSGILGNSESRAATGSLKVTLDCSTTSRMFVFNTADVCLSSKITMKQITTQKLVDTKIYEIADTTTMSTEEYPAILNTPIFLLDFAKYLKRKCRIEDAFIYVDMNSNIYFRYNSILYYVYIGTNPVFTEKFTAVPALKFVPIRGEMLYKLSQSGLFQVVFEGSIPRCP